jgi:sugar O-acyltransferase (sialic acid O-acetyltransferase NeuD family)
MIAMWSGWRSAIILCKNVMSGVWPNTERNGTMSTLAASDSVVLVGAEERFAADVVESLGRLGATVAHAIPFEPPAWSMEGVTFLSAPEVTREMRSARFFIPRNNPGLRKARLLWARELGFRSLVTIIDPKAVVAASASVGQGVYVNAGAVIAAQAVLGDHVFVNRLAGVGHHAVLDDFVSVGPGASICSRVTIGRGTMIGAGASIAPDVTIGANTMVAVGAVVHKHLPSNVMVAGNPARVVQRDIAGPRGHAV